VVTHLAQGDAVDVYVLYVEHGGQYMPLMGDYRTTFMGYLLQAD
jgi:hypothetical protein